MTVEVQRKAVQAKMQEILIRLNLPFTIVWVPDKNRDKHGLIDERAETIFLFDETENEAWLTFEHEILEYRLKAVSDVFREMINGLIGVFERLVYKRKEQFLDSIPETVKIIEESRES